MEPNFLINIAAFTVLSLLWLAFLFGLFFNRSLLDTAWKTFRGWPLLVRVVVALLTLPIILGLWIWQAKWPTWLRLVLVIGLAWMTVYTFYPAAI